VITLDTILNEPLYIFIGLFVVLALFIIIKRAGKMPYVACDALLTKSELHFYRALKLAIPPNTHICMKVRMGDIITCSDSQWKAGWGPRVSAKHIDFVLINSTTTEIIVAIELDDSTHRTNRDRIERDIFVNKAFDVAGVHLLRIDTQRNYNIERLKENIDKWT
jgi:hypothetical protein